MLPKEELTRLAAVRGGRVTEICLCAMGDCGEEFAGSPSSGFSCVTWGVVLNLTRGALAISWSEDPLGDPFRIAVVDPASLITIESVVQQEVSTLSPWSSYIGCPLDSYKIIAYQSNYARRPSRATWHSVPWGLLLQIGSHELLAAAARHQNPFGGPPCADEVVVAFSDLAIRRLSEAREGERSEWSVV